MTSFSVPSIFWVTIASVAGISAFVTLIGRAWCDVLPYRFKAQARFYLAPALGLAFLTIIASLLGWILPLGNSVVVPWLVAGLLIWAIVRERCKKQAFFHAVLVSVFSMVCGATVLAPLFAYGAFYAHTDAFTYLVHSSWLQLHAFGETVTPEIVTPLTTQVSLYQHAGYRMGGSFMLAFLQALLNLHWSYEVYPAVVIAAIAACCLAIGFPLAKVLRPMRRGVRLTLIALPAFSLGGLVFGANLGFLPQTIGLSLGASLLFTVGPLFRWVATTDNSRQIIGKAAFPGAVLFVGATLAYTELAPFLLVALVGSGFILTLRSREKGQLLLHGGVLLGLSALVLNTELLRAYAALRMQSSAVVGDYVDWDLLGFIAHAFGVHGGAWDGYQWAGQENVGVLSVAFGVLLLSLVVAAMLAGIRSVWRAILSGVLMPIFIVLMIFLAGLLYFRYFVPSPFPKGVGQSWSQFKLSDWAHPFVMALVLFAIASLRPRLARLFNGVVLSLFAIGVIGATYTGVDRFRPLMHYYGVSDLNRFYIQFRDTVLTTCPATSPIYLALGGENHKFRQMATLYLYDREVRSDWTDDGYFYPNLPRERWTQELTAGSCVVERKGQDGWLSQGAKIGPFVVGVFDGTGPIRITSVAGAYGLESDGQNWQRWVEHKVSFKLQTRFVSREATQTKLRFEYATRGKQTLALRIVKRDGSNQEILLQSKGDAAAIFEKVIDVPPIELAEISIETDGEASPLGNGDPRVAAWLIRNLNINSASL